jgi:predicted ThiF/HesA family dinucleotide-utilizing enzyme
MFSIRSLLSSLTINVVVACITVGVALGVTNVLVNHVHWFGAYLISCSNRDWRGEPFIRQERGPGPIRRASPT